MYAVHMCIHVHQCFHASTCTYEKRINGNYLASRWASCTSETTPITKETVFAHYATNEFTSSRPLSEVANKNVAKNKWMNSNDYQKLIHLNPSLRLYDENFSAHTPWIFITNKVANSRLANRINGLWQQNIELQNSKLLMDYLTISHPILTNDWHNYDLIRFHPRNT